MAKRKKQTNRKKEVLKAQNNTRNNRITVSVENNKTTESANSMKTNKKDVAHELPIKLIKKDIRKTLIYAVFSIGILVALNVFEVSHTDIISSIKNLF